MKKELTTRQRLDRAINRTPFFPGARAREDAWQRLKRIDAGGPTAPMEAAGLRRSMHSYMEAALAVHDPDWRTVKALHAVWSAADAFARELGA